MSQEKYIGMDVHPATISVAVMDAGAKLIRECLLETKAATRVEFIPGLHGTLALTFEEGTSAAWLHDLLKPHVCRRVVCDPRKNARLQDGSKSDRIDARKLAELLPTNQGKPVYHAEPGVRTLTELGRSYLTLTPDVTRVMNSGPFPVAVRRYTLHDIVPSGWPSLWNQEFGCEPNGSISHWMGYHLCASKRDSNYCGKATSILP